MEWSAVESSWNRMRSRFRERYGKLTDDDLERIGGHKDRLLHLLQERYGYARDSAEKDVEEFIHGLE